MNASCPIRKIIKRDGKIVNYDRLRISAAIAKAASSVGNPNQKLADSTAEKVEEALSRTYGAESSPTVEDIQDVVESVLMENGLARIARSYIIYRHQRAMARASRASLEFEVKDNVPYRKIYEVLRWNMDHQCDSVAALNRITTARGLRDLATEVDRRYEGEIDQAAARILDRSKNIRMVVVAGPSSSGKTTATIKLSVRISAAGLSFKTLNLDNYFFDIDRHPVDEFGDHDYETPNALDLPLINQHLQSLLEGKTVRTPRYNFKSGVRRMDGTDVTLKKSEILLIDSLHGLYEPMTDSIPSEAKFRLYVETLGQFRGADGSFMRWSDNRLLRRMIRDKDHRNLKPMETLTHWHYVRQSEIKHIIPYIRNADFIVNSALPYELPVLRKRLFVYFSRARDLYKDDPRRRDAHIRANRVYEFLKPLKGTADDSFVAGDSLLREFIGGSEYRY